MEDKLYHIESLNLVSFLLSKDIEIIEIKTIKDKNNEAIKTFLFKKNERLYEVIKEYGDNEELKKFIACFKQVREMVRK